MDTKRTVGGASSAGEDGKTRTTPAGSAIGSDWDKKLSAEIAMVADVVRKHGREGVYLAMSSGGWCFPLSRRTVFVRILNADEIRRTCEPLTDNEMAEYIIYVDCLLAYLLVEQKGNGFFQVPGTSEFSLLLVGLATFGEARAFLRSVA